MSDTITYLSDAAVTEVRITTTPHFRSASGYGRKIPTRFMLKIQSGRRQRWHRVYVMCYSNSGSAYVLKGGKEMFLEMDTEHRMELYVTAVERSPETPIPQPTRIDKLSPGDRFRFHADGVVSTLLAVGQSSYRWQDYAGMHHLHCPGFAGETWWPHVFPTQAEQTEVKAA